MEALGSPSISRARWARAMLSEYRKLVYADDRYTFMRLPEIHFTASGFFSKDFWLLVRFFVFVSFWSCFSFSFLLVYIL